MGAILFTLGCESRNSTSFSCQSELIQFFISAYWLQNSVYSLVLLKRWEWSTYYFCHFQSLMEIVQTSALRLYRLMKTPGALYFDKDYIKSVWLLYNVTLKLYIFSPSKPGCRYFLGSTPCFKIFPSHMILSLFTCAIDISRKWIINLIIMAFMWRSIYY